MKRFGQILKVKDEYYERYKLLHASVWPGVEKRLKLSNFRNYSIFHRDGYLFAYYEYVGDNYEADMKKMAEDPTTQEWWQLCTPCQEPIASAADDEWWVNMETLFYME